MNDCDVIVVGAGIGGAVLALALGSRGWNVKVLEREAQPPRMARPEILWGATPAALDRFGVGDMIRSQTSVHLEGVRAFCGKRQILSLSQQTFRAAKIEGFSTDPGLTREVIASAAIATGHVSIERGVEVREILRDGPKIVGVRAMRNGVQLEERASLVVGDDGANSVVRAALARDRNPPGQAEVKFNTFPLDFVTAAISWPVEIPANQGRVFINARGFREGLPAIGCLPWPGGRGVLLMPMPHARAITLLEGTAEAFWSEVAHLTPLAATFSSQLTFPRDFRRVQRPYGHAPHYVADGVAIIGDAAHPVSPAGGQGANASIWDALALAEVAHEALTAGDTSRNRLARFEALRRPRNHDSLRFTLGAVSALGWLSHVPGLWRMIPTAIGCFDSLPFLKARLLSTIEKAFVTRAE